MPLWQSMQVRCPVNRYRWWTRAARAPCLVMSMDSAEWQFRHSSELLALSRAHSCSANSRRMATNLSRVLMVPKSLPQTSLDACILRAILSVHWWGTWQSGQVARTPERFVKWIVVFSSSYTLVFISWQPTQNFSLLVASSTVLKPPQNMTPAAKPPSVRKPRLRYRLGFESVRHGRSRNSGSFMVISRHPRRTGG